MSHAQLERPPRQRELSGGMTDRIGVDMPKGICAVGDCERPREKRDWCEKHYQRWKHKGDPEALLRLVPLPQRLEALTDRSGGDGACWPWLGTLHKGYGRLGYADAPNHVTMVLAHRLAYEIWCGPIPDDLTVDHTCHDPETCPDPVPCRHRACCNPAHLELVTRGENSVRGGSIVGQNARKTHCKWGHPFAGRNLYITAANTRGCRACDSRKAREYNARLRAKAS